MALADAILEIAKEIEEDIQGGETAELRFMMKGYVRSIRNAVKAAEGTQQVSNLTVSMTQLEVQKQREEEIQKGLLLKKQMSRDESNSSSLVMAKGGGMDGTYVTIDDKMPVAAKMEFSGQVYVFGEDRQLHFSAEETEKYRKQRQ